MGKVTVTDGPELHQRVADAAKRYGVKTKDVDVIRVSQVDTSRGGDPAGSPLSEKGIKR